MPETSTQPAPVPVISPTALSIVLFGMPDAGKSSLLGALAQAAQTQQHVLNGRLIDKSQGLAELQHRLYEERPRETLEEIVPYPVTLEPFAPQGQASKTALEAVLVDCDGRVANELLTRQDYLQANGSLTRAILEADTLVLVVDASAHATQLDRDFNQFGRFMEVLEKSRGRRSDVGGLPVYLVLTKCDLLAQKNDSSITWIDRIEERKRQVGQRFKEFLTRKERPEPMPFGSVDLHFWATAVKRPALAETPPKPREPYGVAELFRQCLESARTFHQREMKAGARLRWTVFGSLGLLGFLALVAGLLFLNHAVKKANPLLQKVEEFRRDDDQLTSEAKLRDLQKRITQLKALREDPNFADLPAEEQEYVRETHQKLTTYQKEYKTFKKAVDAIPDPQFARTKKDLEEIKDQINQLQVNYKGEWSQTEPGQKLNNWDQDVKALEKGAQVAVAEYNRLIQEARRFLAVAAKKYTIEEASNRAGKILSKAQARALGEKGSEQLLPGAVTVTYDAVYQFSSVADARSEWERDYKGRLEKIANAGGS